MPHPSQAEPTEAPTALPESGPACVLVFNANDPSGAGGLGADIQAMASVGAHALPIMTGAYVRDSATVFNHYTLDDEAVAEQAQAVLEDIQVQVIKVGFAGSPDNLGVIAGVASDYEDVPLVAYMPSLSWWEEHKIEAYLDAFQALILPQTKVLVGNHSTLWRWLLPDWSTEKSPGPRDIARAAQAFGVPYTLVTGMLQPDQFIANALATPHAVLVSDRFERFEAVFSGAGDTLSAALAALLAGGAEVSEAAAEALHYLDGCLDSGFHPGMGHAMPDRLFWAQSVEPDDDGIDENESPTLSPTTAP